MRSKAQRVRHRSPRRRAAPDGRREVQTESAHHPLRVSAAAQAALAAVWAELPPLIAEAAASGQAVVVVDPAGMGGKLEQRIREITGGAARAAPVAIDMALGLAAIIDEETQSNTVELIRTRAPGAVPVIVNATDTMAITLLSVRAVTAGGNEGTDIVTLKRGVDVHKTGDENEFVLSLEGALKVFFNTPMEEIEPQGRDRIRRFQERGRAALAAEAIRACPRDAGAVLLEAFGGARLRAAWRERGPHGLVEMIDATLAEARPS